MVKKKKIKYNDVTGMWRALESREFICWYAFLKNYKKEGE